MKQLLWQNEQGQWIIHYRRPDNHKDVKGWEEHIKNQPVQDGFGAYQILTIVDEPTKGEK